MEINVPLNRITIPICTVILAGAFGAGTLTHPNTSSAAQRQSTTTTSWVTPQQRLITLGFAPTEAKSLLGQMDGIGPNQRYAAERIAMATEWGDANAFGPDHSRSRNRP